MSMRSVIFGLILAMTPVLAHGELAECSCKDLDKLKQELENAIKLRDRHQAKADEMERRLKAGEPLSILSGEYKRWEEDTANGAGAGIVATMPGRSTAIQFVTRGDKIIGTLTGWTSQVIVEGQPRDQYDAKKAHAIEAAYKKRGEDLCDFAEPEKIRKAAENSSFGHEENHRKTCQRMGYIAFFFRSPVEVARDEVNAYSKQVTALENEIGKVLRGADAKKDKFCKPKAYQVTGSYNDLVINHTVCDLTKPFTMPGIGQSAGLRFSLTPNGDGGSFTVGGRAGGVPWSGGGNYTVSTNDSGGKMALSGAWQLTSPMGVYGHSGTIDLTLTKAGDCSAENDQLKAREAPNAKPPPKSTQKKTRE
jgi:hypothetical protein